ncbi:MAG: DUF255 domain-containing protein [Pirellulales bacterium]|nr:DUF255 domain-containing protein [Pirellulales bacterium]
MSPHVVVSWRPSSLLLLGLLSAGIGCSRQEPGAAELETKSPARTLTDWGEHTQGLNFVVGYHAGMAKARGLNKPALLFVTESPCGWSKRLASENFNDPQFRDILDHFVLVIVDRHRERDVADRLGATQSPFIAIDMPMPRRRPRPIPIIKHYMPRPEFERSFWKVFERLGIDFTVLPVSPGVSPA